MLKQLFERPEEYSPISSDRAEIEGREQACHSAAKTSSGFRTRLRSWFFQHKLQGTWTATKAERDGKAADDIVGRRLSFTGNRFQILSKDGKPLYAGTVQVNPNAKPWAIDFEHTEEALKRKTWKGIYVLDGDTLTICDNAPNLDEDRPASFETKSGSGHELMTFKRAAPDRA